MTRKPRSANLTHEQKRLICLHARQFPKTTQTQLGKWAKDQFNLDYAPSQAAMSYLLKKRAHFELVSGEGRDYKKMRTVKCPEVDAALANWFLYCQVRRFKLPGDLVRHKARVFYELISPQLPESVSSSPPQFSNGWMHCFMGRHGFSRGRGGKGSRAPRVHEDSDGRSKFAPETSVISTPDHLKAAVMDVLPENVYWLHETRLFYAMSPDRQALPAGHHPDKKLTMFLAVNADGSDRMNPYFVGPHPLPVDSNANPEEMPFQFTCNHKAWMPPMMLQKWLRALDWRMRITNREIVLIVDSVSAMTVQKLSLSNVKMHFVERNHAGELCVRPLEVAIVSSVKRRYRYQLLDYALDRREEGQLDIYDVPLEQVVEWVARGWQQIPRSRIMAAFTSVGVLVTTESGAEVIPDNRTDDKLDAQIQALLKRLKLVSPMRLVEVVAPTAEKACDEDLTDADFADSALHSTQGSVSMKVSAADISRHVATMSSAENSSGSSNPFEAGSHPGFDDDSYLEWSTSQRAALAAVRPPISDLEAVHTTIRLASEMNCDPVVLMELTRIHSEVASRDRSASNATTLTASSQTTTTSNGAICQFRFGAPTRRLL